jgi:hypothetical protein
MGEKNSFWSHTVRRNSGAPLLTVKGKHRQQNCGQADNLDRSYVVGLRWTMNKVKYFKQV